jgi:hypothetical protein
MKRTSRLLFAASLLCLPALLHAQPTAHYVPGAEGLKGASLPPPGWYVRDYNLAYYSTRLNDAAGNRTGPDNFSAFTYANEPRAIWITETKILGGYLGVDALLPLVYQNVRAGDRDSNFGIGDVFAEGTLSWHIQHFDFSVGAGFWAPTGDSVAPPSPPTGQGFWTPMLTAGATWYIDREKTWSVSALNRYEFNTEQDSTGITPGQAYTLEWGVGKSVTKTLELGVAGYYQQQTTGDQGGGSSALDRVAAVGPEISLAFPKPMVFVSFRYLYEFMAKDRAQGQTFSLTLTKRF